MKNIVKNLLNVKQEPAPILSFPVAKAVGTDIYGMVTDADIQAKVIKYICDNYPVCAVFNMMDLSVEAEAFGAEIRFENNCIPEITGSVISDISEAENLNVPSVGTFRTKVFAEGVRKAKCSVIDIPLFCGVIGPFSLACRLYDMTELMMECFDSPDEVKLLLEKCTEFITEYIKYLQDAGADGVMLCEPAAGLLSSDMAQEFSTDYVKRTFDAVSQPDFVTGYHNCGPTVTNMTQSLSELNADIYHFGNAVELSDIIPMMPKESIIMGNLDPLILRDGSEGDVTEAVLEILKKCEGFDNFILSTGCDIPADIKEENLNAFFEAAIC